LAQYFYDISSCRSQTVEIAESNTEIQTFYNTIVLKQEEKNVSIRRLWTHQYTTNQP